MIGTVLRIRYELVQELEDGVLFKLFKARDRVVARDVAIRVLNEPFASEPTFIAALGRVVERGAKVPHPSIERMLEVDEDEGIKFIVCEYSAGSPLGERIQKLAPFSAGVCLGIGIEICGALNVLHEAGLVHGDISSKTVWASNDNRIRVTLSGLWETFSQSRTAGAVVLGNMAPYLAPEITHGEMPSPQSDIYALGVLMYELLIGRQPFAGETPMSVAVKHATQPLEPLRNANPNVPMVLDEVVQKMLSKQPSERYEDTRALLSDLRVIQDGLRFGRQLTWPLPSIAETMTVHAAPTSASNPVPDVFRRVQDIQEEAEQTAASNPTIKVGETSKPIPNPEDSDLVAPRMGAVRKEVKPRSDKPELEINDSVPKWLQAIAYIFGLALMVIVGGFMYWNFTKPRVVIMPNIMQMKASEAQSKLKAINLKMRIVKRQSSDTYTENTILDSNPAAKQEIKEGSTVNVTISSGSRWVDVPNVVGRNLEEARTQILEPLGLSLREPVKRRFSNRYPPGVIVAQDQEPGMKLEKRTSKVSVTVSKGPESPDQLDVDRVKEYSLKFSITDEEPIRRVRVFVVDSQGEKLVYERAISKADGEQVIDKIEARGPNPRYRILYEEVEKSQGPLE
jgi:eukaryotic-like serine/threonine-protein kinase